jgi:hypothetical protein
VLHPGLIDFRDTSVFFPALDFIPGQDVGGVQENTVDTLVMIDNSPALQTMLGIYLVSC